MNMATRNRWTVIVAVFATLGLSAFVRGNAEEPDVRKVDSRKYHFALAGEIDVDNDGKSDTDLVRRLITLNGGVIDAEIDERGIVIGKLSSETGTLIIGKLPGADAAACVRERYDAFLLRAKTLGIEMLAADKLLEYGNPRRKFIPGDSSPFAPRRSPPGGF
jgi:hypothetical protein